MSNMGFCGAQAHAEICEAVYRWLERLLEYHAALAAFLGRLAGGAFIHASVESMLLVCSPLCQPRHVTRNVVQAIR